VKKFILSTKNNSNRMWWYTSWSVEDIGY
jgi:hypothetical protein